MDGATKRERKRWDDPDSGDDDDGRAEGFHPQTDQGDRDDDEGSDDALKASDSDDGGGGDTADLEERAAGRRGLQAGVDPSAKGGGADGGAGNGLWDPLAGIGPRKKRKVAGGKLAASSGAGAASAFKGCPSLTAVFGFAEGTVVVLVDLQKAPQLNGTLGTIGAPLDRATGRCQVVMRDGTVKSLRQENLREVSTGAVVRITGLQGAAELNGRIAECGDFELASGRYAVILADGQETVKKVKGDNLEVLKRYLSPFQMLSVQRRPFTWADAMRRCYDGALRAWSAQLAFLAELGLPAPRLVPGDVLARLGEGATDVSCIGEPIPADRAPVDSEGRLACRLLAVSLVRDTCCPRDAIRVEDLRRLGAAAKALLQHDASRPPYFLLPGLCVKPLPCLRSAAACAWPLYLHFSQALLCVESPHRPHKAWCRAEVLVAGVALAKPIYLLSAKGDVIVGANSLAAAAGGKDTSWLLSDRGEETLVGAPADGQVLPAERPLLEKMLGEVLPEGVRKGGKVTHYRL